MSAWLIAFVGCIYAGIAIAELLKGNIGLGIAFAGYAFSNVGLYMVAQ